MHAGRILNGLVIVFALLAVGALVYSQYVTTSEAYGNSLVYNFSRETRSYDYTCDEPVYGIHVALLNNGTKTVSGFSVSVTNPLCNGAVPSTLPAQFPPAQRLAFYVYSAQQNGTVTVSGNNTLVQIRF
ncbi:MAG: hypothetical protein M1368_06690 [Thaumarchaeota archaeon]|nr:hypothetical protein [Nitrososphaerota archaeon]